MNHNDVLLYPVISEKTTTQRETQGKYVFHVHSTADKLMVKQAVKAVFNVEPTSCRVINVLGKKKRTRRGIMIRPSWKKAIVTLKKGEKIPFFEGI